MRYNKVKEAKRRARKQAAKAGAVKVMPDKRKKPPRSPRRDYALGEPNHGRVPYWKHE